MPFQKRRPGWIALSFLALMSLGASSHAQGNPAPSAETPPPNPNGYDMLVAASQQFKEAAGDEGAISLILTKNSAEAKRIRQRYARHKASALNLARAAIKLPFRQPPLNPSEPSSFSAFAGFRQLARGFAAEAKYNVDEGKYFRAASSGADSVEMGIRIAHGGTIISALVGHACEAIGRISVWEVTEKLNAKSARSLLRRLQVIETNRAPLRELLMEEKRSSLTMQRKLMTDAMNGVLGMPAAETDGAPDTSAPAAESPDANEPAEPEPPILEMTPERIDAFLKRQSELYDALIAAIEQPYSAHAEETAMAAFAPSEDNITFPVDGMLQSVVPMFQGLHFKETLTRTRAALQALALALQAYRKEHSDFPTDLRDLTKGDADTGKNKILARIPADPFSPKNQIFRYRRLSHEKYLLYSVGPDGKDDDGKPVTAWNFDQGGDMVVGANIGPTMFRDAPP